MNLPPNTDLIAIVTHDDKVIFVINGKGYPKQIDELVIGDLGNPYIVTEIPHGYTFSAPMWFHSYGHFEVSITDLSMEEGAIRANKCARIMAEGM